MYKLQEKYWVTFNLFIPRSVVLKPDDIETKIKQHSVDPEFKGTFIRSFTNIVYCNQKNAHQKDVKMCKEVYSTTPIVMFVKKDFYLLDEINQRIDMLISSGLIEFWHFQDVDKRFLNIKHPKHPKVLTVKRLNGSLYILLCGYVISSAILGIELVLAKHRTLKATKNFQNIHNR